MTEKIRDHLANERTFLAWVRTSLGLIGLGFVLARMGLFLRELVLTRAVERTPPPHLGQEFLVSGIVFLALGTLFGGWSGWAYHRNRRAIEADRYEPNAIVVTLLASVVVVGGLTVAILVVWRTLIARG